MHPFDELQRVTGRYVVRIFAWRSKYIICQYLFIIFFIYNIIHTYIHFVKLVLYVKLIFYSNVLLYIRILFDFLARNSIFSFWRESEYRPSIVKGKVLLTPINLKLFSSLSLNIFKIRHWARESIGMNTNLKVLQ